MVFDEYDFEFLRLCGLCRYVPTGLRRKFNSPYFSPPVIYTLRNNGYVKMQSDKTSYKLTFAGKEALAEMGYTFPEDAKTDIKKRSYQRKMKSALFNITLHLAEIDVFADKTAQLSEKETGYVSSLILRSDTNIRVLAGTRFLGLLKLFETVYIPYYLESQQDWIIPKHESEIYKAQVNAVKGVKDIRLMLTGDTLEEIWKNIHPMNESQITEKGMRRFDEALEELGCDYSLVPVSRDGVEQLSVMRIWRYREKIAKAIGCNIDNVYNLSECDGFQENTPYIIAIDFNVKRILRALKQVERYDKNIVPKLCCLPFQKRTLIKLLREHKIQNSMVLALDIHNLYRNVLKDYQVKPKEQKPHTKEGGTYISANQRKITKANIEEL